MLTLTPGAVKAVQGFFESDPSTLEGKALRVFVEGGGCSGFQYGFRFSDREEHDTVLNADGFDVLVDATSLPYLEGAVVDFVDSLEGRGFTVQNPNAEGSCGCGKSFSV